VIAVSSGEVYGSLEPGSHADEAHSTVPLSPYSASKLAAEIACQQAQLAGLDVMIVRPFNHLGRGQTGSFVVPAFAQQLAALAGRAAATLRVGDLSPVRDFLHVADVVEAYRLLLERGLGGQIYNIASGVGRSIRDLLSELIELSGADVTPEQDPERMRPNEIPYLVGDANKLQKLGWSPSRTIRQALSEVLQEAREAAQV
jgi:GDP-4-dehydro-6-deoxy-D-mannose reductase